MGQKKKLLFLSALYPLPVSSGTQARVLHLLQRLSRRFDVTFLVLLQAPGTPPELERLQRICARVIPVLPNNKRSSWHRGAYKVLYWIERLTRGECSDRFYTMMPSVARAIRDELRRHRYDILFLSYWFWSPWVYEAPGLKVVDTNDVHWERQTMQLRKRGNLLERLLSGYLLRRYQSMEVQALQSADLIVSATEKDRAVFADYTTRETRHLVVPTGIDTAYFIPSVSAPDLKEIVFYGALGNLMNVDAVTYFVKEIWPRIRARLPEVRFTVVGSSPPRQLEDLALGDAGIRFTGYVEDVREPLSKAGVVVLPLRFGYGIRGRIFELFSMGIPVVATPIAVEGMELESGQGLRFADSPEEFALAVVQVLQEPALHRDLAQRGRALAEARFSVEATYDRLVDYLDDTTTQPERAGS